jgi:hypothetical protein
LQKTGYLVQTQDDGYFARLVGMAHFYGQFGVFDNGPEEKFQRRDPGVEIAAGASLFNQVQVIPSAIFGRGGIRRTLQKACESTTPRS